MDFLPENWTLWTANVMALLALLKSTGKEIQQLWSTVRQWTGWTIISRLYRRAKTRYRLRVAKKAMRRTLETKSLEIGIQAYDNCLAGNPSRSKRDQLGEITPAKPHWLNDYYVAVALESLSAERDVVKATRYSPNQWPPRPQAFWFEAVDADRCAREEAARIEANSKCLAYQSPLVRCSQPTRFEFQAYAQTLSPASVRHGTTYRLKDKAPPCELCWEKEVQERDIRNLVDNITKYDLADMASPAITGTNGEFQKVVADACIESQCSADVDSVKVVVTLAIELRRKQIAPCAVRSRDEWRLGEKEELVAALKDHIDSQITR